MALEIQSSGPFPIVVTTTPFSSNTLSIGTIAYQQTGVFGTPIGLLVAITNTPQFNKVIQSANGLQQVN